MKRRQNPNQTRHHRLVGHDYSAPGFYFITFGTRNNLELLGTSAENQVKLAAIGDAVSDLILKLPEVFPNIVIDCYVVMPNHIHILIYLPLENTHSVSEIVRSVKGPSTAIHRELGGNGPLWHKGFHDEIIRNDKHLEETRRYIAENPTRWKNLEPW